MKNNIKKDDNTLAILSLVFSFLFAPVGLVLGMIALSKKQSKALAISGITISSIGVLFTILMILIAIFVPAPNKPPESEKQPATEKVVTEETTPTQENNEDEPNIDSKPRPYEIIYTDYDVGITGLNEYYILTDPFDYSNDNFKNEVKLIVSDIAKRQGTDKLIVDVITDREVLDSETDQDFIANKGPDYYRSVVVPKSETAFVASYTGGFDHYEAKVSDEASAYTILWFGTATTSNPEIGKYVGEDEWRPLF